MQIATCNLTQDDAFEAKAQADVETEDTARDKSDTLPSVDIVCGRSILRCVKSESSELDAACAGEAKRKRKRAQGRSESVHGETARARCA